MKEIFAALDFVTLETSLRMRQCQPLPWGYDAFLSSGLLLGKFNWGTLWKWGRRMLDMECSYYRPFYGYPGGYTSFRTQFYCSAAMTLPHLKSRARSVYSHLWWKGSYRKLLEVEHQNINKNTTVLQYLNPTTYAVKSANQTRVRISAPVLCNSSKATTWSNRSAIKKH